MTKRYWLHMRKICNCQKAGVKLLPFLLPFSMHSLTLTDMTAVAEARGSKAQFSVSTATPSGQLQHCNTNHVDGNENVVANILCEDSKTVRMFLLRQQ